MKNAKIPFTVLIGFVISLGCIMECAGPTSNKIVVGDLPGTYYAQSKIALIDSLSLNLDHTFYYYRLLKDSTVLEDTGSWNFMDYGDGTYAVAFSKVISRTPFNKDTVQFAGQTATITTTVIYLNKGSTNLTLEYDWKHKDFYIKKIGSNLE